MEDFLQVLFGDMSFGTFFGYIALCLIGVGISVFFDVKNRDVGSKNTPKRFSTRFFIVDNLKRFIGVILALYALVRFSPYMFPGEPIDWVMISLGYNIDAIIAVNKKGTKLFEMDRELIMRKEH